MKPQTAHVLAVLRDGRPHSALEFKRGVHGLFVDSVAQRISELRALGYVIAPARAGHAVATYRLTHAPDSVPDVHEFGGALFDKATTAASVAGHV